MVEQGEGFGGCKEFRKVEQFLKGIKKALRKILRAF
jgi:hypothetical protein